MASRPRTERRSDRCKVCGYVQNLRRAGTFGRHHVWLGRDYLGVCPGAGMKPEDTTSKLFFKLVDANRKATRTRV